MSDDVVVAVAHIVYPGSKMHDVDAGKKAKAKALCGTFVTKWPTGSAPICRPCFNMYIELGEPPDIEATEQQRATTV